ncbi:DUF6415 family natural product biosynthesis protein [Streptomyces sp. NBC_01565]|uniref:DUF6415 family natural product biosynthesis protein n=1 Tax=Streptomyces sp. NBC_01565 TaxID=2975881 RepID=UPI0022557DF1|nr:DUF6415 family natural product biosynthesis protein [Streptomyces sp. NBC_01565]MCX4540511.1 DUF6415 family natural product biosynthesis protein [Streptomyces sp. NBC_01565]
MTGETQTIEELAARALRPYEERPDAEGVARLVDDLITVGHALHTRVAGIPVSRHTQRADAALAEWSYFVAAGPLSGSDHAAWNHARGLGRIARVLVAELAAYTSTR